MERKSKKELIALIEEQNKSLTKYKSRLHDIVESYKHLVKEKEVLETSIKSLTDVEKHNPESVEETSASINDDSDAIILEKVNDDSLQKLKSSLGALTVEKARVENELRADRRKLLAEKEELEHTLIESDNKWSSEKEKYENLIQELKKKVSNQQREREKEQQDHALMLKELQNLLAVERANKEKFEEQVNELQHKLNLKLSEKKTLDYEKYIELQNKLKVIHSKWQAAESLSNNHLILLKNVQEETEDMKERYQNKLDEETRRADDAEEKLKLLTLVKEKRIANLEARISDLSAMVGNYDKTKQQHLLTIQKLKEKINQLQAEYCTLNKVTTDDNKFWDYKQSNLDDESIEKHHMKSIPQLTESASENILNCDESQEISSVENIHVNCQAEILQLREELEVLKSKAENALKEKHSKSSHALLSDARSGKEIKELKSQISQLQDLLHTAKSQIKLNEDYHNTITTNLEKSVEELKTLHRQEISQMKIAHQTKLMELEHQIQKQRERTLSLLEEKDKEIGLLKTTFLSSVIKKDKLPNKSSEDSSNISEHEAAATLLSNSLISSQKDGHILHYVQELARKDIEISNLRHSRVQTETALRKLQQASLLTEEKRNQEIESLKCKVKLLESSKDRDGTNVEYLKNVVLRFLKCKDPSSQRHMVNAIATVLHFTNSEVQEVKSYLKA